MNAGFRRDLLERPVAAVVVEIVGFTLEPPRAALHQNTFEAAKLVTSELWEIVHVEMRIARDEQINVPIPVIVAPRCTGHESAATHSSLFRDVFESAVPKAMVECATCVAGHHQIQ